MILLKIMYYVILYYMKKARKRTSLKKDAGKLLLDLGKLMFGGIFIGGILRGDFSHISLIAGGFMIGIIFCVIGLFLVKEEEKTEE